MSNTTFNVQHFIQLALNKQVLKFGEFTLKSGRISPYFFNAGLLADGEALSYLAKGYADAIAQQLAKTTQNTASVTLFGAAYKGIPFVAATAQALWLNYGINADWGYNRKEAKTHGEGGQLVGADLTGKAVWVIDDVITAGTAMREVIGLLKKADANVAGILVALDRKERGEGATSAIQELRQQLNVPVQALVTMDDLIDYLNQQQQTNALTAMQNYRQRYGVA